MKCASLFRNKKFLKVNPTNNTVELFDMHYMTKV